MFSDLLETMRNRWRATGKPALQSLLAEKRSFVSTFAVLLLLETLLCILLLSYANGQRAEQQMQGEISAVAAQAAEQDADEWLRQSAETLSARG